VDYEFDAQAAEDGCRRQGLLAALAETDEVRQVHEALEQLYRTQLVAMEAAERLDRLTTG
jgi:hypothetical protein